MEDNYTINIGNYDTYPNRCLSASYGGSGVQTVAIPWAGTEYNPWDYIADTEEVTETITELDENGEEVKTEVTRTVYTGTFTLSPIEGENEPEYEPTTDDRLNDIESAICELYGLLLS